MDYSTRTAVLAVTLTVGVGAAFSQPSSAPSASSPTPAASAGSAYRSAFDGYRAYSEQPVQSWRESNATVGRIDGRQSPARERQSGPLAGNAPPETNDMEDMPGMAGKSEKAEKAGHRPP